MRFEAWWCCLAVEVTRAARLYCAASVLTAGSCCARKRTPLPAALSDPAKTQSSVAIEKQAMAAM